MKLSMICVRSPFMEGNVFCSKCGKEVAREESFCLICGSHKKQQTPLTYGSGWYYLTGDKHNRIRGPFSESSIRKMFSDGTLNGNTNIRFGINSFWSEASEIPLFQNVVKTSKLSLRTSPKQHRLYLYFAAGVLLCILIIYMILFDRPVISVPTSNEQYRFHSPTLFNQSYTNRRLANGTILSSSELNGRCLLTVRNGLSLDAVVKLVDTKDNTCKAYFYVSSGNEFKIEGFHAGTYRLKFFVGEDWDSTKQRFSRSQIFSEFDRPMFFTENEMRYGDKINYNFTTMAVTINPVINGNAPTHSITESDFK